MITRIEIDEAAQTSQPAHWNLVKWVSFRFCFTYLGLYCITSNILGSLLLVPLTNFDFLFLPSLATLWPLRQIVFWAATHIFHINHVLVYNTGSGDKAFDWIATFCLLVFAIFATVIWSVIDRRRDNYVTLYKWFRLAIRFALSSQMILYGMDKVFPLQMSFPSLTTLVEPFGNLSPSAVLWSSIGVSAAYEIFTGCAEMLGGVLLIVPRTTVLGALVCLADLTQVFVLNMTYNVGVKKDSFHFLLLALFLLAPDYQRLVSFFFLNRTVGPSREPQLFRTRRANRMALAAQVIFGVWLAYNSWGLWHVRGVGPNSSGRPKSALYGIWDVGQLSIEGQIRAPLLTDYDRWRRVIFDFPDRAAFQRMDSSFARYGASISSTDDTVTLTKDDDKNWKANFNFQRAAQDQLILDGEMDNHKVQMHLELVDRRNFLLLNRGFHWIQEYPFNEARVR